MVLNNRNIMVLLALTLTACAHGTLEQAGDPPPKSYRATMAADFLDRFRSRYRQTSLGISQPQPGARDMISGWRVCVRAVPKNGGVSDAVNIAYFFVDKHIYNVTENDITCGTAAYEPWPEIDHVEGWPTRSKN